MMKVVPSDDESGLQVIPMSCCMFWPIYWVRHNHSYSSFLSSSWSGAQILDNLLEDVQKPLLRMREEVEEGLKKWIN